MEVTTTLFGEDGRREFLVGFLSVAFVVGVFGAGLELGAASAGESVQPYLLATMAFGALSSGAWIARRCRID